MTTPAAAAPAAPAAAALAPAPAAAPAAAPAVPAVPAVVSLLDGVPAPAAAPAAAAAAPAAAAAADWFLAPDIKGTGAAPDWFKSTKYKSVDEQAKAYTELEGRFGAFVGAPKDGKYEFKMPEGISGDFDAEHPIYKGFNDWAVKNQLNNDGYNQLLGMFAQYEAGLAPDMNTIKADLGEKADERIGAAAAWAKANFDADTFEQFRVATSGANAAAVFTVMEAAMAKSRQIALPPPGDDTPGGGAAPAALVAIKAEREKKDAKGNYLIFTDQKHREKVAKMEFDYAKAQPGS